MGIAKRADEGGEGRVFFDSFWFLTRLVDGLVRGKRWVGGLW